MSRIQEAQDIIENFQSPEKLPQVAVLTHLDDAYTLTNINQFSPKKTKPKVNLDWLQATHIGQGISEQIFPNAELRYAVITTQSDYNLSHKNNKYKKNIKKPFWNHDRELAVEGEGIISFPTVYVENDQYKPNGKIIEVEINTNDVFDTLIKAGLFEESKSKPKLWRGSIYFENGYSSVWSRWLPDVGCFYADAYGPSLRNSVGLVVLGKTDEKVEIDMTSVATREYKALLEKANRLRELEPAVKDLTSTIEGIKKLVA